MKFVIRQTEEAKKFALYSFDGDREIALANGYSEISDEDFDAIRAQTKCWDSNGNIIDYVKSAARIERERKAEIVQRNNSRERKIARLQKWFEKYDVQVSEYSRAVRLGTSVELHIDEEVYASIAELDAAAVAKAAEIKAIRESIEPLD